MIPEQTDGALRAQAKTLEVIGALTCLLEDPATEDFWREPLETARRALIDGVNGRRVRLEVVKRETA